MALKQRAEQSVHTETLGWEEEEEGMLLCRDVVYELSHGQTCHLNTCAPAITVR